MNSCIAFRCWIAIVLLLSIGWKMAIPADNPSDLTEYLVKFLESNHFDVVVGEEFVNYTPLIRATRHACEMQVTRLTPDGSNRDLVRHFAAGADRSFVVFRGAVYVEQPVFWTVLDYVRSRVLRELGLTSHVSPVLHVAQSSSCTAERLPWELFKSQVDTHFKMSIFNVG